MTDKTKRETELLLRDALEACRQHLRHHNNASGWWNDPTVRELIRNHIDPALDVLRAALTCAHGEQSTQVVTPATIEELEAILNSEGDEEITINPDGSIKRKNAT